MEGPPVRAPSFLLQFSSEEQRAKQKVAMLLSGLAVHSFFSFHLIIIIILILFSPCFRHLVPLPLSLPPPRPPLQLLPLQVPNQTKDLSYSSSSAPRRASALLGRSLRSGTPLFSFLGKGSRSRFNVFPFLPSVARGSNPNRPSFLGWTIPCAVLCCVEGGLLEKAI
jgi:hypothetical protein